MTYSSLSDRGRLYLKLVGAVLITFVLAMCVTWCVQDLLSAREVRTLIGSTFEDVKAEISDVVNDRLVRQAMAAREELEAGWPTDEEGMRRLAKRLRITELNLVNAKGIITASTEKAYLGFDFRGNGSCQASEFLCLLEGETEFCQSLRQNVVDKVLRKYVGVWRSEGGFVQIGCDLESLRGLTRSSLVDLFKNWNVAGAGGIVVTSGTGLIISDYERPSRDGTQWRDPNNEKFYWGREEIEGFPVYIMVPRLYATIRRDVLVGSSALLNGASLAFVAFLVAFVIAAFVRRQIREQTAKDLKMATAIQTSALPSVFPPFPDEPTFDIYATMATAKEVGGDFYDFYFTGPHSLVFLVADVSGKGVPAAMFMMRAKALLKSAAQTGKSLAAAVAETNDSLCEGNEANMFVTAWIGEINIVTGDVTYVNAGHNPPIVRHAGAYNYLAGKPGLVLGAMAGVPYKSQELKLAPGDALYLYTDGITEQINDKAELFGETRLLASLNSGKGTQRQRLEHVTASVMAFAGETEQADDCTQLVLDFRGPAQVVTHAYKPTMEDLAKATGDLEAALASVPMKEQMKLMVAADEIFANIVRYSGATAWSLTVEVSHYPDRVRLILSDDGKPFDPLSQRDPDTTLSAESRGIGGVGILIVKKTMSPVTYSRKDGQNVLTMGLTYGVQ